MTVTPQMSGKSVLITGGIGRAAAIGLASMGARVGITGRDRTRAERAAAIARESGNPAVEVFVCDMSSQVEVWRLAGEVLSAYPRLEVLLNNVGGFWAHRDKWEGLASKASGFRTFRWWPRIPPRI